MTLEQTTTKILAATDAQDLALLRDACKEREDAMAVLRWAPPTPDLRDAVAASLAAGDEARHAIRAIRQGLVKESRHLMNIENGFLRALRPEAVQRINCKG
jgi:hypothetical protein